MTAMTDDELAELERAAKALGDAFVHHEDVARLLSAAPRLLAAARERNALAARVAALEEGLREARETLAGAYVIVASAGMVEP